MKVTKLTPNIKEIKKRFEEISNMMLRLRTKQDAIDLANENNLTIEINGILAENFDDTENIEWFRCEEYYCLDYIYYRVKENRFNFDVWSDDVDFDFIDNTTINDLEKNYYDGINWIKNMQTPIGLTVTK